MNTEFRGVSFLTKTTADLGPEKETFFSDSDSSSRLKFIRVFRPNFEIQISLITELHAIEGENSWNLLWKRQGPLPENRSVCPFFR